MIQPRNGRCHFFIHILLADPSHMVRLTAKETGKCSLELESHIHRGQVASSTPPEVVAWGA